MSSQYSVLNYVDNENLHAFSTNSNTNERWVQWFMCSGTESDLIESDTFPIERKRET